ncbi:MAG: AbrB/MazE/SpoVT family DNA-binding domain-containing protein [Propionibacteriaceae bacterium]|nr:AbrB/MazE/SpoVT family DNA-binding domain-containing protein [Propionibacteriaceae bacterium]
MSVSVSVSSKGQITLPVSVREQLGIDQGDRLTLIVDGGAITLRKQLTMDEITALAQQWAKPGVAPILDADAFYQAHRDAS